MNKLEMDEEAFAANFFQRYNKIVFTKKYLYAITSAIVVLLILIVSIVCYVEMKITVHKEEYTRLVQEKILQSDDKIAAYFDSLNENFTNYQLEAMKHRDMINFTIDKYTDQLNDVIRQNFKNQNHNENVNSTVEVLTAQINEIMTKLEEKLNISTSDYSYNDPGTYMCTLASCSKTEYTKPNLIQFLKKNHPNAVVEACSAKFTQSGIDVWGGKYFLCNNELFDRYVRITKKKEVQFCMQVNGPEKRALLYEFQITITNSKNSNVLNISGQCDAYKSVKNMITLEPSIVKDYIENNAIVYTTTIIKKK